MGLRMTADRTPSDVTMVTVTNDRHFTFTLVTFNNLEMVLGNEYVGKTGYWSCCLELPGYLFSFVTCLYVKIFHDVITISTMSTIIK